MPAILWFLLRALFLLFAVQALIGLGRFVSRSLGRARPRDLGDDGGPGHGGSRRSRPGSEPMIDRSTVIDVPFTEEERQAAGDTPPDATAPDARPGPR